MRDSIWKVEWLEPLHSGQKSFYKKAKVETIENWGTKTKNLWSYRTKVAQVVEYDNGKKDLKVFGWYSNTTAKHIGEFLQQNGFERMSKKQMLKGGY